MEKYHERKTARDHEYVCAYLLTNSQNKAAELCGVGRQTIARAVHRASIPMHGYARHPAAKITDSELWECVKVMTCSEIAHKYSMSRERVYRRAKRLGITLDDKLKGGKWRQRAEFYGCNEFDSSITLEKVIKKFDGVCQLCGKPINKEAISKGHPQRDYPTVDHIIPLSKGGSHTWGNVQLAHMGCNAGKRDRTS